MGAQRFRYDGVQICISEICDELLITVNTFLVAAKMGKKNRKNHLYNKPVLFSSLLPAKATTKHSY
jgi:hypothetical protein